MLDAVLVGRRPGTVVYGFPHHERSAQVNPVGQVRQLVEFMRSTARRPTPVQDKLRAVARFGWRQVHKRVIRKPIIVRWEGMKLVVAPDSTSAGAAYYFGRQDAGEFAFLERLLRRGDVVADVGANVGVYAMFLSRLVGKEGKVIACEPDPKNLEVLCRNVSINALTQVQVEDVAIGATDGRTRFLTGLGTVSRISGSDDGVSLPMRSLDSLCGDLSPVFVKVDVEGGEEAVVNGARGLLDKGFPLAWQLEIPAEPKDDDPLYASLRDRGYVFGVYDPREDRLCTGPVSRFAGRGNVLVLRDCPALHDRLGAAAARIERAAG